MSARENKPRFECQPTRKQYFEILTDFYMLTVHEKEVYSFIFEKNSKQCEFKSFYKKCV